MVNYYTYLEIFLDDLDKRINLGEFEKYFKIPHQTIRKYLDILVKANILIEEKKERLRLYWINKGNPLVFDYISICEKQRLDNLLKNSLFKSLYAHVSPHFNKNNILIFGSSVNGANFKDIDLFVISKDNEIKKILRKFEQTYSIKLHIIQTNEKDISKPFIKELIKSHIILNNHDYFVNLLYKNG
ncbi:hypothetical protein CMO93_04080 [Candidatus Woesearchaeota archaeon]|jgi:hypothetical protein|nr:hypothetical protein [Candidatus Woesearchaeota archaeon]|tara:strand:- start:2512 stop:3069 length:558 start_codon:yes stop_codon:yes gene_type:complete